MDGIIKDELRNKVWTEKYKAPTDNSPDDTFKRVSKAIMGIDYLEYYKIMKDLKFIPGGRILAGAGMEGNLTLANCYVIPIKDDSIEAIFDCAKEAAETYKTGGGVGIDISCLRPQGAKVNNAARTSSGSISFMEIYDKITEIIGGKHRRGALIICEHVAHPDIFKFISIKDDDNKTAINNANISVKVTDAFMVAVEEDSEWELWYPELVDYEVGESEYIEVKSIQHCFDHPEYNYFKIGKQIRLKKVYKEIEARELWNEIIKRAWNSAEPGIIFWDVMKDDNSTEYDNPINNVNPCVTENNYILTSNGWEKVKDLIDNPFNAIINGNEYSSNGFFYTGEKEVYKVTLTNGAVIECTKDHKFFINENEKQPVETLVGKEILLDLDNIKNNFDETKFQKGYLIGHCIGDGHIARGVPVLAVWDDKGEKEYIQNVYKKLYKDEKQWRQTDKNWLFRANCLYQELAINGITCTKNKHNISQFINKPNLMWGIISGLIDTDGSIQGSQQKGYSIRISQSNYELLNVIRLFLLRNNIYSKIRCAHPERNTFLPDGKGGSKEYNCKANYELIISSKRIKEISYYISLKNKDKVKKLQKILSTINFYDTKPSVKIKKIERIGKQKVYDCTVDKVHRYNCEGVIISNCGEITLAAYGACCLGSINVARFVHNKFEHPVFDFEEFARCVKLGVEFLDNVLDKTRHPLKEQNKQMQDYRRIGLGLTGIAHCLVYMKIKYDSEDGIDFVDKLGAVLEAESYKSSFELAKTKGAYPKFVPEHISGHLEKVVEKGILDYDQLIEHGIRNCALNTIAPSGSISILADCSSGIEPIFQLEYERRSDSLSKASFMVYDRAWKEYQEFTGSSKKPEFFVTAHEIDPLQKIKLQSKLQHYIDNSISVTTNLPKNATIEDVEQIYKLAWEVECKGCTIYREGSRSAILGSSSSSLLRESHEILNGRTIMIPLKDKIYITVNTHPITEKPMEVFISSAKSGSDKKAVNEGYGRLISLFLQQGGKIEDVITTLLDIKAENIEFANGWTVQSLPDAIAKGLLKCAEGIEISMKCPECGGIVSMTSGCMECRTCGYSRCG